MKKCGNQVGMTYDEEKILNETVFSILLNGMDIIQNRKNDIEEMRMKMDSEKQKELFKQAYCKKHGLEMVKPKSE